jgi:hypothetical protein
MPGIDPAVDNSPPQRTLHARNRRDRLGADTAINRQFHRRPALLRRQAVQHRLHKDDIRGNVLTPIADRTLQGDLYQTTEVVIQHEGKHVEILGDRHEAGTTQATQPAGPAI